MKLLKTLCSVALLTILGLAFLVPGPARAIKYEVVVFDPNWQPPPGVYSGGRAQATGAILDHIQSNFAFAGTTIQVGSQAPASTGANDRVNTVKFIPSNSTAFFSHHGDDDWKTAAWGVTYDNETHYVFGGDFNKAAALNNSSAYTRAAAGTAAHELGHGLNATHTGNKSDKRCSAASAAEKAGTNRDFTDGNQARMKAAASAGGAVPGHRGKESITIVYSQLPTTADPLEIQEEKWYVNVTFEILSAEWDFGYLNAAGNFIDLGDIDSFFDVQLFGGVAYEFAVRNKADETAIYALSTSGQANLGGALYPPELAVAPPMSPADAPYFGQANLIFNTMMGPVQVFLSAEGPNNGFAKLQSNSNIPVLQNWGMILLVLILLAFAAYRIHSRMKRAVA
jgi:hypothetical protein